MLRVIFPKIHNSSKSWFPNYVIPYFFCYSQKVRLSEGSWFGKWNGIQIPKASNSENEIAFIIPMNL